MVIYNILKSSLIKVWPSLVIITVTLSSIRIAYLLHHRSSFNFHKEFWTLLSVLYMILLYELVTRVDVNINSGVNLIPFTEITRYKIGTASFYMNVLGNIALFIPFGYMASTYIKPKRGWANFLIAIIVSITIEFVQLNIGRSFDIDDIILNTVGCMIGYLLYIGMKAINNKLPDFLKSDWFNNLICIIIIICIVLYVLFVMGIKVI